MKKTEFGLCLVTYFELFGAIMKLPEDKFILELLPEFLEDWYQQIEEQFDELVNSKKKEDFYRLAHTMKGSCYQFGFQDLGDIGVELMQLVKDENWDAIKPYKQKILNRFKEIINFL